jgi:hypothetical protein
MILSMALLSELAPIPGWGSDVASSRFDLRDDRLAPGEEELAYSAKSPAERVTAFLRIADRKLQAARKAVKQNPSADVASSLQGYLSAFEGAEMSVSWGQSLEMDMHRQVAAIGKTSRKHLLILAKLESAMVGPPRNLLLQVKEALSRKLAVKAGLAVGDELTAACGITAK